MEESGGDDEKLHFLSREELEERIRTRTSELENVMDAMADVLITLDETGDISMINGAVEGILGYEPAALEGKPIDVLITDPPEDTQSPVSSSDQLLERLLREGQVTDVEIYCSTVDGGKLPMSLSASTLVDDDGIPNGIVCVAKDISERKAVEEQASFLHSLLRHDLGNSLQVSQGYLEILSDSDLGDAELEYVERALDAIEDAAELVENVRTLNRIDGSESVTPTSIRAATRDAVTRHEKLSDEQGIDVESEVDDVSVLAGTLLTEVFANLVENALVHSNADRLCIHSTTGQETVTVTVEDDGDGIDPGDRERIFKRGYSVGDASGSGLGMYIVRELVESYGGDVSVEDSPIGGARFEVTLQRVGDSLGAGGD